MRRVITALALTLSIVTLSGCGFKAGSHEDVAMATGTEPQTEVAVETKKDNAEPETKAETESSKADPAEDEDHVDADDVFREMSDWMFHFSSGAGGWETELFVEPDGSFHGRFYDGEMGSTGPGYSNGTLYECAFKGHFDRNVRMAGPLMYSLTVSDMEYEHEPDTEEIKDDTLYKYSTPYGLEDTSGIEDALVFMYAGAVTSAINEEEMSWLSPTHFGTYVGSDWDYIQDKPEELPFAAIINTKDQYAFFSGNNSKKNKTFLVNKVQLPGLKNTVSTMNDDQTYYYEDKDESGNFKVINACYHVNKEYDTYDGAEELVKDALKLVYKDKAPNMDEVYVTSPKDAYEMDYDKMVVNGEHSDYAFWYPDGDKGGVSAGGRFLYSGSRVNDTSYIYAYIIESGNGQDYAPDSGFGHYYLSSLMLTGRSDHLSSAGEGKGAVRKMNCEMEVPFGDSVSAMEAIMVGSGNEELIKKYHLENADFDDDYEMVYPDNEYHEYKLSQGGNTPFYMQYPEDHFHRLYYADNLGEYMEKLSTRLMEVYLNEDNEIVYGYEQYTP